MITIQEVPLLFTKKERTNFVGENNRKGSQDENCQKQILKDCFNIELLKLKGIRVNESDGEIKILKSYMQQDDPSAWTEDFDGVYKIDKTDDCYVFSLKMIPEQGGAQGRSIKLVYHHLKCCVKSIQNNKSFFVYDNIRTNIVKYVFILDGEYIHSHLERLNKLIPNEYKSYFYVGPSKNFMV